MEKQRTEYQIQNAQYNPWHYKEQRQAKMRTFGGFIPKEYPAEQLFHIGLLLLFIW
jgi:hypothetical protein